MAKENLDKQGKDIANSIANFDQPTPATIPQHIAKNLMEFLHRVQCTGMEAVAWVEAYQFVQQHAPKQAGIPFAGLPPSPK